MLLIGIILGGAGGYLGHQFLTQPELDELSADVMSISGDLAQLQSDYEVLNSANEITEGRLEDLQQEFAELEVEKETLQSEKEVLHSEKVTLDEEHADLNEQFELLSDMYESLLEDYEMTLGGLDFSNQTIPVINRTYTWTYNREEYTIDIAIPETMLEYYSGKERYGTEDYRGYLLHPYDDLFIRVITGEFDRVIGLTELTEDDKVGLITSFVQSLEYEQDPATLEYPKFPVETLSDGGGDCEDTSILMGHLLKELGIKTALIHLPDHMALAIEGESTGFGWILENTSYYYMETTATGWKLGDVPSEFRDSVYELYPNIDQPFITNDWDATIQGRRLTVTVTYTNETPLITEGYEAWVGIELSDGEILGKTGIELDLDFKETRTTTIKIDCPRGETMKMVVGVLTPEGFLHNKDYSQEFTVD